MEISPVVTTAGAHPLEAPLCPVPHPPGDHRQQPLVMVSDVQYLRLKLGTN